MNPLSTDKYPVVIGLLVLMHCYSCVNTKATLYIRDTRKPFTPYHRYTLKIPSGCDRKFSRGENFEHKTYTFKDSAAIFLWNENEPPPLPIEAYVKYGRDIAFQLLFRDTLSINGTEVEDGNYQNHYDDINSCLLSVLTIVSSYTLRSGLYK